MHNNNHTHMRNVSNGNGIPLTEHSTGTEEADNENVQT